MGENMSTLVVDFAALDRMRTAIEQSIEDTEQILESLTAQVRSLADLWSGAASEGFQRTVADWMAGRQDLQRQLAFLHDMVATAHSNHANAVATNVAMWRI
jgi:WXG100 family type VII secretion target